MQNLFEMMLNASFSGSVVILAVMVLRLLLKKAPRSLFCLLWMLAGLRLMLPFEIESSFSLQPRREEITQSIIQREEYPAPETEFSQQQEEILSQESAVLVQPQPPAVSNSNEREVIQWDWESAIPYIWLVGIFVMCAASVHNYRKFKRNIKEAWRTEEGIWESDRIRTAFVLGFFPPKIYLPAYLSDAEKAFILGHERAHIIRRDHWYKLAGYIVLTVHWFNPLVWLGYSLLCRDIEYACDARVVQDMSLEDRKRYSAALLNCGAHHANIAACPVAFAESDPKGRIHAVLSYRKPGFWISLAAVLAVVFVAVCLMTDPESTYTSPEIPELEAPVAVKTRRLTEPFNPNVVTLDLEMYEDSTASFYFDPAIPESDRAKCLFYSEGILSHFDLAEDLKIILIADYDGAWVNGNTLYLSSPFDCVEYGAKLITLLCGGYANYGAAYGYADYIAVAEGWKLEDVNTPRLTVSDARDLNWLCFCEAFVSTADIKTNKNAAVSFANQYIDSYGEAAYRDLLMYSGSPETVAFFNTALSEWYAENGLVYTPSEILYAIGSSYHDYLVKCPYATFYLPKDWDNAWASELTKDPEFLHKDYIQVKTCFETNAYQMGYVQQSMGFDSYDNDLTVEFMTGTISQTKTTERLIRINSIEDLPMMYVYWITLNPMHMRDFEYARIDSYFYVGMAKYVSINNPNLYESQWKLYTAEHGEQAGIKNDPGWNENLMRVLKGEKDPYQILKKRWDFISYFYDDYYDSPGNGLACSLPLYLIDKYGYETMFDYVYITDRDPIELDLVAERDAWITYLEDTYKEYPKYSGFREEKRIRDPDLYTCTDENCTDPSHDHSERNCTDPNCTDPTHGHHHHDH